MTALQMGANALLMSDTVSIEISILHGAAIDVTALMLYSDGKALGDGDMFFVNQTSIGGALRLPEAGETKTFDIDLSLVSSGVQRFVVNTVIETCARRMGDITSASVHGPGTESIEVVSDISGKLGGPVGMLFSVYRAITNGAVSIASLKSEMSITYQSMEVICAYWLPDVKESKGAYIYKNGTVLFDGDHRDVGLSGFCRKAVRTRFGSR